MHRLGRIVVLGVAALWFVVVARPVAAHAIPVAAVPEPDSIVAESPPELRIQFNEPVVPTFSRIQLFTQAGEQVETGPVQSAAPDDSTLSVSLPPLNPGTYLVNWQVLSAVDGHTTSGSYPLGVGVDALAAGAGGATVATQVVPLSIAARVLNLLGLALVVGAFAFRLLVWRPTYRGEEMTPAEAALDGRLAAQALRVAALGLAAVAVSVVLTLIFQAEQFEILADGRFRAWLATPFGATWLLRLGLMLGLGMLVLVLKRDPAANGRLWWAGLLLSLGFVLATTQVSHSAALATDTRQAMVVDFVHVLGAGLWGGGLLFLALALRGARALPDDERAWLNLTLNLNFSTLAAAAVGALLLSGGYLGWRHVGGWTALLGTLYGQALLVKIALSLPALLIAAVNLLWVKPRLQAAFDRERTPPALYRRFHRLVAAESVVAALVLVGAGLVSDLQRGADAPLLADQSGEATLVQQAGDVTITLTLTPALVGANTFDIYIEDENGRPVADADDVSLRFTFLGQSLGTAQATAENVGGGRYRLDGRYLSLIGNWQVEVAVRRPGAFDAFAPFRLSANLGGRLQDAGAGEPLATRLARLMTQSNGLFTGIGLVLLAVFWGFLANRAARFSWQLAPLLLIGVAMFWVGAGQLLTFYEDFTPAMFTTNPILPDADSIRAGRAHYEANCQACHGATGRGDGPAAASLSPPPADFAGGHTATHPDGDLFFWIKEGIEDTGMPGFEAALTDEEVWHLVNYVRRLSAEASGSAPTGN